MSRRGLLLAGLLLPLAAIGAALVSQHAYGMEPCPWCILQRLLFVLIALWSLLGLLARPAQRPMGALVGLTAVGGIAAALWQHFVAAASQSCNLTWPDRLLAWLQLDALLPEVFQPRASCADAAVSLLGVPYEFWSLVLFVLLGAIGLAVLRRR
jgi:protein dithiol:quinone oxidoreductase